MLQQYPLSWPLKLTLAYSDIEETNTIVEFVCKNMDSPRTNVFTVFGCTEIVVRERVEIDLTTVTAKQWIEIQAWPDTFLSSPGSLASSAKTA